jgi:hypothetical protein
MSFNYAGLQNSATALLQKFGRQLTFTRTTKGAYSAATGTTSDSTATFDKYCCVFDYSASEINNGTIQQGDRRILSEPYEYELNDTVSLDSKVYRVIGISENKPAGTLLSVDLQVRA